MGPDLSGEGPDAVTKGGVDLKGKENFAESFAG